VIGASSRPESAEADSSHILNRPVVSNVSHNMMADMPPCIDLTGRGRLSADDAVAAVLARSTEVSQ
jgi:hypothetical protein